MYKTNETVNLDGAYVSAYIQDFKSFKQPELRKWKDYYESKHTILRRTMSDDLKPNNRIVHSYANYITNTMSSYFMGHNVSYTSKEDLAVLNKILKENDEASENLNLARDASIYGVAYELVYIDVNGKIRFKRLNPIECIPIYDDTIDNNLLYLIRFYDVNDILTKSSKTLVELYTREEIKYYTSSGGAYTFLGSTPHGFKGAVPVAIFKNNEDELNDFGKVISLIDAYDEVVSDSVNDLDQFSDSYLVLKGLGNVDDNDLSDMKSKRILLLDDESDAFFLVKNVNDTYAKNVADRLNDDIYKFSGCVDLTSDVSALSGIAIKMRLLAMENVTASKESQFKKGLLKRIELIGLITNVLGGTFITSIDVKFTRDLPTDDSDSADLVNKLQGIISDETLISLLPFIDDPIEELERRNNDIYKEDREDVLFNSDTDI